MTTQLINIGSSKGVSIPQNLIEEYQLEKEIEIKPVSGGIFITKKRRVREGWDKQIKKALAAGDEPDNDPIESINEEWDNTGWTWPE